MKRKQGYGNLAEKNRDGNSNLLLTADKTAFSKFSLRFKLPIFSRGKSAFRIDA